MNRIKEFAHVLIVIVVTGVFSIIASNVVSDAHVLVYLAGLVKIGNLLVIGIALSAMLVTDAESKTRLVQYSRRFCGLLGLVPCAGYILVNTFSGPGVDWQYSSQLGIGIVGGLLFILWGIGTPAVRKRARPMQYC